MLPSRDRPDLPRVWSLLILCVFLLGAAGCTQEQATLFGKILFGVMVVFFIVVPIVFWVRWRRERRERG